ncbi:MAG: hypothetical protein WCK77_10265 [Verrucomicrobiota bacterium]
MCAVLVTQGYLLWRRHRPASPPPRPPAEASAGRLHPPSADALARFAFYSDCSIPHQSRITRLREALAESCSAEDLDCLYHLLITCPRPAKESEGHWFVLANDLMSQLCRRDPDAGRFTRQFLAVMGDASRNPVLRDYAVQHLAAWVDPRRQAPRGATVPAGGIIALRRSVITSMAKTAIDPTLASTTVPGTVLMALVNISRVDASVCSGAFETLRPWITKALADGSNLSMPVRVSIIHAAAAAAPANYLPAFRAIAYRREAAPALRLAAIAAIAANGDKSDLDPIRAIPADTPALAFAAKDATRVLSARMGT